MIQAQEQARLIDKVEMAYLHFPKEDVLHSRFEKLGREADLKKALSLGNLDQFRVKICFQDIEGLKYVETTIWGLTATTVILKKGIIIPIPRISSIEFI